MSKTTTLKHALADGTVETRQTARAYTHVVVGTYDVAFNTRACYAKSYDLAAGETWAYAAQCAAATAGARHPASTNFYFEIDQKTIDSNKEFLREFPTAAHYVISRLNGRLSAVGAERTRVLQWSSSSANAVKGCGNRRSCYGYKDVHVETINQGVRK